MNIYGQSCLAPPTRIGLFAHPTVRSKGHSDERHLIGIYIYLFIYINMNMYLYIYLYIYTYMCLYIFKHTYVFIYIFKHTYVCIYIYTLSPLQRSTYKQLGRRCFGPWFLLLLESRASETLITSVATVDRRRLPPTPSLLRSRHQLFSIDSCRFSRCCVVQRVSSFIWSQAVDTGPLRQGSAESLLLIPV